MTWHGYADGVAPVLWVKQFGLERSGTNYVKALLEMSSPDVRVLATVLGSKHAPPDLEAQVARLELGDVGIAVTDLDASDFPLIIEAYRDRTMGVVLCVRDVVTWMDAYERHMARREKREAVVLGRDQVEALARTWAQWVSSMSEWSQTSGLRSLWAVHHEVVRQPQALVDAVAGWGGTPGQAVPVNYLRKAGDHHGSANVTQRPYRTRQYRDVYSGAGQVQADDVEWARAVALECDTTGLAERFLWDRRPLRKRSARDG